MNPIVIARKSFFSSGLTSPITGRDHGYNYTLEVFIRGEINSETGLVVNLSHLDELIMKVLSKIDHKNFDKDIRFFFNKKTSLSTIAQYCCQEIEKEIPILKKENLSVELFKIRLYQGSSSWVDICNMDQIQQGST